MNEPLVVNGQITIDPREMHFSFARSSGPGGQNVNKVNTKAVLRWRFAASVSAPPAVLARFKQRYGHRLTEEGDLVLASGAHRERGRNIRACRERLCAMLLSVAEPPKRRKKTRPPRGAIEARLKNKSRRSQIKQSRRPPSQD